MTSLRNSDDITDTIPAIAVAIKRRILLNLLF